MRIILIALGVMTVGSVAANARSALPDMPMSTTISYSDLDLSDKGGRKLLDRRVKKSIQKLCLEATGPIPNVYVELSCRRFAWKEALPQIAFASSRTQSPSANQYGSAKITVVARR